MGFYCAQLFLAVLLGMSLHCLFSTPSGMNYVTPRSMSVVCRHLCPETIRHLATGLGKLRHDLLVQPHVHFRRAIKGAAVAEFLR